jgi:hypothetical protein
MHWDGRMLLDGCLDEAKIQSAFCYSSDKLGLGCEAQNNCLTDKSMVQGKEPNWEGLKFEIYFN